jgi:3-isopropylmalate/(R)-2-methylmalate dehydratase small subunit
VREYGFRVIIAPSYADIFYNNCFQNGILPATLSEEQVDELFQRTESQGGYSLAVSLLDQTIRDEQGHVYRFEMLPHRKEVLLKGLDEIGITLQHADAIAAYEKSRTTSATMYDPLDVKHYSAGH